MSDTKTAGLKPGYLPSFKKVLPFADFLKMAKEYPALCESSFQRMARLILREGYDLDREKRLVRLGYPNTIRAYNAFSKRFKGIDVAIHRYINDYILPGAAGGEASKQIFVAIGGKGSGKSQFFNAIKRLLRKAEPAPYLIGSKVRDNPLSLFYMVHTLAERAIEKIDADYDYAEKIVELRAQILATCGLEALIDYNAKVQSILNKNDADHTLAGIASLEIDDMVSAIVFGLGMTEGTRAAIGHPDAFAQSKLLGEYEWEGKAAPIAQFPIGWFRFTSDFEGSIGVVDVSEVEPNNFEIGTWIGWEDLSQAGRYKPGDPRNVVLNGALPQANRGQWMATEGFKNPKEARRVELEATQGKRIPLPAPLVGSLFLDTMLAINSNEAEYNAWINDAANEPYKDRYMLVWFKYPLEVDASKEILLAIWNESEYANTASEQYTHLDPLVPELGARLEVLTRIEPHESLDLNAKVDAYNGVQIRQKGQTKLSLKALRDAASPKEGLTGNSPRELGKQLGALAAEAQHMGTQKCVTARALMQRLVTLARETLSDEEYKKYKTLINTTLDEYYRRNASRMWLAATISGFKNKCQEVFNKYLDNIQAFVTEQAVEHTSGFTRVQSGGDKRFMSEIESDPHWGVTESDSPKFRAEIVWAANQWLKKNRDAEDVPYDCHEQIRRCIERYVVGQLRSTARTLSRSRVRTDADVKLINEVVERLKKDYGYCECCADDLLRQVEEKESFLIES
jgi:serine protein kinase